MPPQQPALPPALPGMVRLALPLRPALALWLALWLAASAAAAAGGPPRPNLLLVLADDMGWGDLGHRGSPARTPHLDRLFREGADLQRFYVAPLCTPTRAALLTGRSPEHFGLQGAVLHGWSREGLPAGAVTLAERLRERGYQTALVGKWHLGHARAEYHPNRQGFEHFYGHLIGASYFEHRYLGAKDLQRNGRTVQAEGYATELLGAEMVRFIAERDRVRPFFLYAAFYAPHTPLEAPAPRIERYGHLPDPEARVYAAMLESLDAALGGVLAALEREGLARDTLVLFASDNGAQRGGPGRNDPLRGDKGQLFEGGIRVPAALRWPGRVAAGSRVMQPTRDLDVVPTLLAAADPGAAADPTLEGRNLLPLLTGGDPPARSDAFFFAVDPVGGAALRAVIAFPWKLVWTRTPAGRGRSELFDLVRDPHERRSLRKRHPRLVAELRGRIEAWEAERPLRAGPSPQPPPGWEAPADWSAAAQQP